MKKTAAISGSSASLSVVENTTLLLAEDNVDHNMCTLDGNNTFHGMGMIAVTPKSSIYPTVNRHGVGAIDIKNLSKVDIEGY